MEPETLKGATEWYNHIELAGLFGFIMFTGGSAIHILLQRWLGPKDCKDCPDIKSNQKYIRDYTLPLINDSISGVKIELKGIKTALDLIMKGLKLVGEDVKWDGKERRE